VYRILDILCELRVFRYSKNYLPKIVDSLSTPFNFSKIRKSWRETLIGKSDLRKNIRISIGVIAIAYAGFSLLNLANQTPFFITYPVLAVFVIGFVQILKGFLSREKSNGTKLIEIGIGIFAIITGFFAAIYLNDPPRSILFLFLFVIVQGSGFVVTGITKKSKTTPIRISKLVIGIIVIALTGVLLEYHSLSLMILNGMLSINLLLIGIELVAGKKNQNLEKDLD
jgi:uncharacterized membrane protein HdeD (DUF308 family)